MQEVTHAVRLALAIALAAASPSLPAVVLGEVQTRSALGEALDARIPFTVPAGGSVDATCFALVRDPADGALALGEGILTIERRRGAAALRIRTLAPVLEPAVSLRVRAACPGTVDAGSRHYSLLLDPRPGAALQAIAAPSVPAAGTATRLNAREGDSLESVAAKVYPRNAAARARYLSALREANPGLAAQDDGAVVAAGTPIVLPDPRTVARRAPLPRAEPQVAQARPPTVPREAPSQVAAAPTPAQPAAPVRRPRAERKAAAAAPSAPVPERTAATAPERAAPPRPERRARAVPAPGPAFVLKLSASEVDLSRSRQIDDRMRAQLRERLLVLDADDQVAAMLSMRNSLRQLEARVAEMQLKLDAMPASLAARTPAAPPKVEPTPIAKVEPPPAKVEPPPPPKVEPAPIAKVEPPPPKVEPAPIAKVEPPPPPQPPVAKVDSPTPARPAPTPEVSPGTRPIRASSEEGLPEWLWLVAAFLVAMAALIGWLLWRRRAAGASAGEWAVHRESDAEPTLHPGPAAVSVADEPIDVAFEVALEVAPEMRPEASSDAALATRLAGDSGELRRRYIEERFPEIQNRTVVLGDPASVVKAARLFYEDGALPRAVELLQFAIEDNPAEVRQWLALFEIFRLERLTGQFAELATRFRDHHGKSEYWRKVQFFGREIEPGNALYREAPVNTLETIGPREAKRLAAGLSSVAASADFDPIAENWLNAPMDFENEVLANEMRMKLMAEASLTEQDLVPNPMPALRSVEMFTVA